MYHILFTPSSVSGYLGYFHLTIVDNATIKIGTQISVQVSTTTSFEYIPRSEIAGSHDSMLNSFRNHNTVFWASLMVQQ